MYDKKAWDEAVDLAKKQLRYGNIEHDELKRVTESIYTQLLDIQHGPDLIDVTAISQVEEQKSLPASKESGFKHEIVDGKVRCAECGKLLKSITLLHLKPHGFNSREEYMKKYGVSEKDMQGTIERNTKKGEDNALTIMSYIMKAYDIKRGQVKPFVVKHGFEDIKDLMAQAKEKSVSALDLLKTKAPLPKKEAK
uniref:ROS/MUCR transcriptional regulator protein n=1 Tax=Desulfovibrio sp. U5L TaxID=596152 RepID=I2PWW9_9BACT